MHTLNDDQMGYAIERVPVPQRDAARTMWAELATVLDARPREYGWYADQATEDDPYFVYDPVDGTDGRVWVSVVVVDHYVNPVFKIMVDSPAEEPFECFLGTSWSIDFFLDAVEGKVT